MPWIMVRKCSLVQLLFISAILSTTGLIIWAVLRVYYNKSNITVLSRDPINYYSDSVPALEDPYKETGSGLSQDASLEQTEEICMFNGYILVGKFNEQLESSIYDLYQLSNIASSWNMQIVEPHVVQSHLGLSTATSTRSLRLSNILNLTDASTMFQTCLDSCLPPLIPFQEYTDKLSTTPVVAVVLYLLHYSISHDTCSSKHHSDAKQQIDRHLKVVLTKDKQNQIRNFDAVCIDITKENNFKKLLQTHPTLNRVRKAAISSRSKLLVFIPNWNGVRPYKDHFFYYDPSWKQNQCSNVHSIQHSSEVIKATDEYFRSLNLKHPLLGVHVRFERVLRLDRSNQRYHPHASECVKKFLTAAERLMLEHHFNDSNAIAFRDFGPQGSATCDEKCNKVANDLKIDRTLNSLNIRTVEYTNQERAFVASVELELLSRVDYLLTLGYGSFQGSIQKRFLNNGNKRHRLVTICSEN